MTGLFDELLKSVQQMDEIHRGERKPSRRFVVDDVAVRSKPADVAEGLFDTSSTPPKAKNGKAL